LAFSKSDIGKIGYHRTHQWRMQEFVMGGFGKIWQLLPLFRLTFWDKISFCSPKFLMTFFFSHIQNHWWPFCLVMSKMSKIPLNFWWRF